MVLMSMRPLLAAAEAGKYAIGAFNVNNMEQAQGIAIAAAETQSPFIYQVSKGALEYSNWTTLVNIIKSIEEQYPELVFAMHLDHGVTPDLCYKAMGLGFTSVMMDGSLLADGKTPSDLDYNIRVTREVVLAARTYTRITGIDITVEGEVGNLKGLEGDQGTEIEKLTNPNDLRRAYDEIGVDAVAIAWGTIHGAYKGVRGEPPKLRPDVVDACHRMVPEVYLVSHGSSSVPGDLVREINSYGVYKKFADTEGHRHIHAFGQDFDLETADPKKVLDFMYESMRMPESVGVPMAKIKEAIGYGMRKINVDTDGRMAVTKEILHIFERNPDVFDPRKYLGPARDAIKNDFAMNAMTGFGSAGRIDEFRD